MLVPVVALGVFLARGAHAQDAMTRASEAFARAEFAESIAAYDEAAAGDGLTRAQLVELLRGRALSRHAALDVAGAEQDLVALLTLEPDAELGDMAPPALQRAFARLRDEVRAPIALEVRVAPIRDGFRVETDVREDLGSLVREIRVHTRGEGEWAQASGEDVSVVAGTALAYFVEAIGPGGAIVAQAGDREAPRMAEAPRVEAPVEAPPPPAGDDVPLIVGLSVGAAVIVAAVAIVLAVLLAPSDVQVSAPMEMR